MNTWCKKRKKRKTKRSNPVEWVGVGRCSISLWTLFFFFFWCGVVVVVVILFRFLLLVPYPFIF